MWALFVGIAAAADWLVIGGTEIGRPDKGATVGGFLQTDVLLDVRSHPVVGIADHDGDYTTLGGPPVPSFQLPRARPQIRGSVPETDQRVNYLLSFEFGTGPMTRKAAAVLVDASVSYHVADGFVARVGRFKLPIAEEALEGNPYAADLVSFSEPVRLLLVENPIAAGVYTGGASGFRDTGVEGFGWVDRGRWRLEVAGAATMGAPGAVDRWYDGTARVRVARALTDDAKPADVHRPEVAGWAWAQAGQRAIDGVDVVRVRAGVGVGVETAHARVLAEAIVARGAVEAGAAFAGDPLVVQADGEGIGASVQARWRADRWSVSARAAGVRIGGDDPRLYGSFTPGLRYDPVNHVQIEVNYELRGAAAPGGDADAKAIAAATGDRVIVSSTVTF